MIEMYMKNSIIKNNIQVVFYALFLMFVSCGYQKPEKDKHPHLPIFPQHTNQKISIAPFLSVARGLTYNEKYFFTHNEEGHLLILDRKFNKIKQINS